MRPVLFLDIDGVLNSHAWRAEWAAIRDPLHGQLPADERKADSALDPAAVARLNRVIAATDAMVVVSSSWRVVYSMPKLQRMLSRRGFEHVLFGCTPRIWLDHVRRSKCERGNEIDCWFKQAGCVATFAIVDDDSDMEPHLGRLVKTDHQVGLTDADADRLVVLLGGAR